MRTGHVSFALGRVLVRVELSASPSVMHVCRLAADCRLEIGEPGTVETVTAPHQTINFDTERLKGNLKIDNDLRKMAVIEEHVF